MPILLLQCRKLQQMKQICKSLPFSTLMQQLLQLFALQRNNVSSLRTQLTLRRVSIIATYLLRQAPWIFLSLLLESIAHPVVLVRSSVYITIEMWFLLQIHVYSNLFLSSKGNGARHGHPPTLVPLPKLPSIETLKILSKISKNVLELPASL